MSTAGSRIRNAKSVAEKMGVRPGVRAYHLDIPAIVLSRMGLPNLRVSPTLHGWFDHIHAFVATQQQMKTHLPALRNSLSPDGQLWLSWPKGGQLETDLSLPDVIRIGYNAGLVESKCISVDTIWSALKFTHPIHGKTYHNIFGQLPGT